MRWFKHPADMSAYPLVARVRSEFGNTGYAAICLMFEKVTASWEYNEEQPAPPSLSLPLRDWKELTAFSPKKFKNFVEICQEENFFCIKNEGKMLTVAIPILLKWRDDYTQKKMRKSGQTPDNNPPNSALQQQKETEEEKRQNNRASRFTQEEEIQCKNVLRRQGIEPTSPRGDYCLRQAMVKATENPAGYLVGTFKKNPSFGSEYADSTWERGKEPMSTKDIFTQLAARRNNGTG